MDSQLLRFRKDVTYAFIDLETFNLCLSFVFNRPWQVGLIKVRGETIEKKVDLRINWPDAPHLSIGKEAALITRFNKSLHDKLAISPQEAFGKFWPILKEVDYVVMHNGLRFDLYLLKDYAMMMGEDWKFLVPKIIDTKSVAQGVKMNIPYNSKEGSFIEYQYRMSNMAVKGVKTSLQTLGTEFAIEHDYDNLHDAVNDLSLNIKVWNRLKFQIEI